MCAAKQVGTVFNIILINTVLCILKNSLFVVQLLTLNTLRTIRLGSCPSAQFAPPVLTHVSHHFICSDVARVELNMHHCIQAICQLLMSGPESPCVSVELDACSMLIYSKCQVYQYANKRVKFLNKSFSRFCRETLGELRTLQELHVWLDFIRMSFDTQY